MRLLTASDFKRQVAINKFKAIKDPSIKTKKLWGKHAKQNTWNKNQKSMNTQGIKILNNKKDKKDACDVCSKLILFLFVSLMSAYIQKMNKIFLGENH